VKHLSYVFYAQAKISRADQIQRGFNSNVLIRQPDMAIEVFNRVEAGITASPDIPGNVLKYFSQL